MDRKTLVVNMVAGPNAGKTTLALGLTCCLKLAGARAKYVSEYAEERTRLRDFTTLGFQPYVTMKQWFRQVQVDGQVDVIVTDSPIFLGMVYRGRGCTPSFDPYVLELFHEFWNYNVFVERDLERPHELDGRSHNEDESVQKDAELIGLLGQHGIPFEIIPANGLAAIQDLLRRTLERLSLGSFVPGVEQASLRCGR